MIVCSGYRPAMDAITLLKADHKTVEQLFKQFEKAGDRAYVAKRTIVDRIIEELSIHASVEEQYFYPVIRATVEDVERLTLEALEEHHIVKWVLAELESLDPSDERFDAKVTVLIENVRHHVKEEENDLFPMVRDELGRSALADLGDTMAAAKEIAPTHPHPMSPDTAPANGVTGVAAGVVDRVGDTVSGVAQGAVMAVGDLIALVLRRKKPKVSPTGSSATRSQAKQIRKSTQDTIDLTQKTIDTAKRGAHRTSTTARKSAEATVKAGARGAKKTAKTGKSAAKRTVSTARGN